MALFHVKRGDEPLPTTWPPDRVELLDRFTELLKSRAVPLGLIADSDLNRIGERHVADSLRVLPCLIPSDIDLVDVGSGAGLPGIPVAITRPRSRVTLLEPVRRKAAFLELAVEELGLRNIEVRVARAEDTRLRSDACFARALAAPARAWRVARPLLRSGGRLLYFAGRSWSPELTRELLSEGIRADPCAEPEFAWQGPIVMMTEPSQ
jgi:16S rRNA (guanine527-N7)-methyltransferase